MDRKKKREGEREKERGREEPRRKEKVLYLSVFNFWHPAPEIMLSLSSLNETKLNLSNETLIFLPLMFYN